MTTEGYYVCLTFTGKDECTFCGGWVHVEGGDILHNDHWYCSTGCVEAREEYDDAMRNKVSDWCGTCGYDNHEHADSCA